MKKISLLISFLLITLVKSQVVSDYKYVMIPNEFNEFKENRSFGLAVLLKNSLRAKKYIVLDETKTNWPVDALTNPCEVLIADIINDKNLFRNKLILQLKDCNNQIILAQKGSSTIKEFEAGFQDAMKQALLALPFSNPIAKKDIKQETQKTESNIENNKLQAGQKESVVTTHQYTDGKINLQKILIDDHQFILIDGKSSVPYANLKTTTKYGVFRVKLSSGESTIGYYENDNIVIENPLPNGEFAKVVFVAK